MERGFVVAQSGKPGRAWGPLRGDVLEVRELAQWLRDRADESGLRLRDLAERTPYARDFISRSINGEQRPRWEFVKAFVEACAGDDRKAREKLLDQARYRWEAADPATGTRLPVTTPLPAGSAGVARGSGRSIEELASGLHALARSQERQASALIAVTRHQAMVTGLITMTQQLHRAVVVLTAERDALREQRDELRSRDNAAEQVAEAQRQLSDTQARLQKAEEMQHATKQRLDATLAQLAEAERLRDEAVRQAQSAHRRLAEVRQIVQPSIESNESEGAPSVLAQDGDLMGADDQWVAQAIIEDVDSLLEEGADNLSQLREDLGATGSEHVTVVGNVAGLSPELSGPMSDAWRADNAAIVADSSTDNRWTSAEATSSDEAHGRGERWARETQAFPVVSAVWGNVPQRNKNFSSRELVLDQIRGTLGGRPEPSPVALHGFGGVGKTQIAIEYIYRYQHEYDVVWWIPSDQPFLVKTALAELASQLGLPPAAVSGIEDAARDALNSLRRGEPFGRWLLVFDNADQPEELLDFIPRGGGHVLITSRNHRWGSLVDAIPVDVFHREGSVEFFAKRVHNVISDEDAARLAEELGDLPLALEQAGALLFERRMSADEYLQQLKARALQLLSQGRPAEYPLPMTASWSVSVANLTETLPEAVELLRVCAFFGSEPIPREAISRAPAGLRPELAGLLNDPIRLGRAVGELGRYALARLDLPGRAIQIHRLVQKLAQDELSPADQERFRHEVHLLLAAYAAGDPNDEKSWPKYSSLLGHLGPAKIADCDVPEVREFAIRMLRSLLNSGDYQSAQLMAEDFIQRWSAASGAEHLDVVRMKLEQANVLRELGEFEQAIELNTEILAIADKVLGPDDDDALRAVCGSAADLRALGDFKGALERDEQALGRYEERYGRDHAGTLSAANNLALGYSLVSDYKRARELYGSYSGWLQRGPELDKASMVHALTGLARVVRLSGEYAEACDLGEDAYAIAMKAFGAEHNRTLRTGTDLAISLRRLGEYERAEELAVKVHERCVRLYGLRSPDTLAAAMCLSNVWRTLNKLDDATAVVVDSVHRYKEVLPADHPYAYASLTNLAVLRRVQNYPEAARELNKQALNGLDTRLGRDHHFTLIVALNLASDHAALGDLKAAIELSEDTLRRLRVLFGDHHPLTLASAANLAADLTANGQTEPAKKLIKQTKAAYERTLGLNNPDTRVFLEGRHQDADFDPPPI
jgi:hypothetical protein